MGLRCPRHVFLVATLTVASCGGDSRTGQPPRPALAFDNAWVRAPVAEGGVAAAYCDITNRGDATVVIGEFRSDDPNVRVEMHETTHAGGVMRMHPLGQLTIPPGETVSLAPGGKHLMLFGFDGRPELVLDALPEDGPALAVSFATRVTGFGLR